MIERIVWQPENLQPSEHLQPPSYDFSVRLDRDFADEMISATVTPERQARMNELASKILERFKITSPGPLLSFEGDTGLVTQFNAGSGGVWLAMDRRSINSLIKSEERYKPIELYSHNVDDPFQACALMALVDLWVQYSETMIEES